LDLVKKNIYIYYIEAPCPFRGTEKFPWNHSWVSWHVNKKFIFLSICSIAAFWVWERLGLGIVAASDGSRRTDS
jgi:hypothetical protein